MYKWYQQDLLGWYLIHLHKFLTILKDQSAAALTSLAVTRPVATSLTAESLIVVKHVLLPNQPSSKEN
jgi:hypothetical protein